jgi:hypothetical protein
VAGGEEEGEGGAEVVGWGRGVGGFGHEGEVAVAGDFVRSFGIGSEILIYA